MSTGLLYEHERAGVCVRRLLIHQRYVGCAWRVMHVYTGAAAPHPCLHPCMHVVVYPCCMFFCRSADGRTVVLEGA